MSSVAWYWHRLRAMSPGELAAHGRRKVHQLSDRFAAGRRFAGIRELPEGSTFPALPLSNTAPETVRAALRRDTADILQGRWIAFGHLPLQVDDPPRWHKDYLADRDLVTSKSALKLHHRLEGKADIKLIWEPNRWYSLVRLAQAAYVLGDRQAAAACLRWLEDWVKQNPPYFGWNWISGLETGLRLIQFTWIDALLTAAQKNQNGADRSVGSSPDAALARLRAGVLLPHLWFTWRDRSFGSSANNHLLGELSGLLVALTRWPNLSVWAAPLDAIQRAWERAVLFQFAPDGGNREQALNYHLFGWEFCWQARLALRSAGRGPSPDVEDRLQAAAGFFTAIQVQDEQWDYGDSDSAYVTPFFADWNKATSEWWQWLDKPKRSSSIQFWIGAPPSPMQAPSVHTADRNWRFYPESGFALGRAGDWFLRWDLSPLGYLSTAGHGHCDALHLSIWFRGRAVLIDPGTGAYHADRPLRDYLSSWEAHNGPHPVPVGFPERRGAFLWSAQHERPRWTFEPGEAMQGELTLPGGVMRRKITHLASDDGWQIEDGFHPSDSGDLQQTQVLWQFAPGANLQPVTAREYRITAGSAEINVQLDAGWSTVEHRSPKPGQAPDAEAVDLHGVCSPAFRQTTLSPFILLRGPTSAGLCTTLRCKSTCGR